MSQEFSEVFRIESFLNSCLNSRTNISLYYNTATPLLGHCATKRHTLTVESSTPDIDSRVDSAHITYAAWLSCALRTVRHG